MNWGGNVAALESGGSYAQNRENGQRTRINYEEGSAAVAIKARGGAGGDGEGVER